MHQSVAMWQVTLACNIPRGRITQVHILQYTWPNTKGLMTLCSYNSSPSLKRKSYNSLPQQRSLPHSSFTLQYLELY